MKEEKSICELCGEELTEQDGTMFRYHGYARDCPKPPLSKVNTCTCSVASCDCPDHAKDGVK